MIAISYRKQQGADSVRALSAINSAMLQDETRKKDVSFRAGPNSIGANRIEANWLKSISTTYIRDRNPLKEHQSW
jgi:hypothetical protein